MKEPVVIVIPLYKTQLSPLEEIAVRQCFNLLSAHKIVALKPERLSLDAYDFKFDDVVSFDNEFFDNPAGYNKLMLLADFYQKFLPYEFMLIYQPDAFVFKDDLIEWCNLGYDYIGAPWIRYSEYPDLVKKIKEFSKRYLHTKFNKKIPGTDIPTDNQIQNRVGNGGLSLRNVKRFYEICISNKDMIDYYNSRPEHQFGEDVFWALEVNRKRKQMKIPGYKKAIYFSMDINLVNAFKLTRGKLPFGCHAWDRQLDFWRPIFAQAGVKI